MTQEDKKLLLKDLCGRLPYGVKCLVNLNDETKDIMTLKNGLPNSFGKWDFYNEKYSVCSDNFKPYLRPMSSMTEEEREWYEASVAYLKGLKNPLVRVDELINWLLKNHFDFRCLIPKGLAIAVTEENNPYEKEQKEK